jgi:hypothetical protein
LLPWAFRPIARGRDRAIDIYLTGRKIIKAKEADPMGKKTLALLLALAFLGCAKAQTARIDPAKMVQHFKGSVFEATDKGSCTTELIIRPNPPVVGRNSADLIIHDIRGEEAVDIEGLDVTATPYMPGTARPSPDKVAVKDAGRGLYILENLNYDMPGKWELKLELSGPGLTDSVVLELPEVR